MMKVKSECKKFKTKFLKKSFRERTTTPTKAQNFIQLQMKLTKAFLLKNQNVKIFPADKGGRIVITDLTTYQSKMESFITSNVSDGIYLHLKGFDFRYVKDVCESKCERFIEKVNSFFEKDRLLNFKNLSVRLFNEPFIISRIYGLFKIHKYGYPLRPIVSSTNCMGKTVEKWMLVKLRIIAEHFDKYPRWV